MTQSGDKLELPRWSKLDNGFKFLYIFTSITFLALFFTMIIYYNFVSNVLLSIGFSIIIAGLIVVLIVHKLEKQKVNTNG